MPKGVKPHYERCTAEVKAKRIEDACTWLYTNPDAKWIEFIEWAKAKWDIEKGMANIYRKEALSKMGEVIFQDAESAKRRAVSSLTNMLRKVSNPENEEYDLKLAFQIRQEIAKIEGAYVTTIEHKVESEMPLFNVKPIDASETE